MAIASRAWIYSIGNELLVGRIVNTNAAWLARRLTFLGFTVERIITVPDNIDEIAEELRRGLSRADVIITTGGLGPTYDDVTTEALSKAVNLDLVLNHDAKQLVESFYHKKGLKLTQERIKMALMPEGAIALPNPVGAAPGIYLEVDDTIIISLPGVPEEMKAIFDEHVYPRLKIKAPRIEVRECMVIVAGVPESGLAPVLDHIARRNPQAYIKSHPKGHELDKPVLEIRVMASAINEEKALSIAENILEELISKVKELKGDVRFRACEAQD